MLLVQLEFLLYILKWSMLLLEERIVCILGVEFLEEDCWKQVLWKVEALAQLE